MSRFSNNRQEAQAEEQKRTERHEADNWIRCSAQGCPMQASAFPGEPVCQFHHGAEYTHWSYITAAIRDYKQQIHRYAKMIRWPAEDWKRYRPNLEQWKFCPMEPNELPTMYLHRLKKVIHTHVSNAAEARHERAEQG